MVCVVQDLDVGGVHHADDLSGVLGVPQEVAQVVRLHIQSLQAEGDTRLLCLRCDGRQGAVHGHGLFRVTVLGEQVGGVLLRLRQQLVGMDRQ